METTIRILVQDAALRQASAMVHSEHRGDDPSIWPASLFIHSDETSIRVDSESPLLLVETLRRLADFIERNTGTCATS